MSSAKSYLQNMMPGFHIKKIPVVRNFNPIIEPERKEAAEIKVDVYDYNADEVSHFGFDSVHTCSGFKNNGHVTWINVDGLRKADVETICNDFNIHPLLIEDILSIGQRPKMDELENVLFCLLNM